MLSYCIIVNCTKRYIRLGHDLLAAVAFLSDVLHTWLTMNLTIIQYTLKSYLIDNKNIQKKNKKKTLSETLLIRI